MDLTVHAAQLEFLTSRALYRGFVGGRGAGKSFVGALDLICRAQPGRLYLVAAPTYPMLRDSSLRTFESLARSMGYLRTITTSAGSAQARLVNGAEVLFRSADDPNRLRGPNLSGVWFDEAGDMVEDAFLIAIACLREGGEQGWLSATFTPRGRAHWTYRVFGRAKDDTALITAQTRDNPFNPPEFEDTLRRQYTSAFAEQELAGRFVDLAGTVARREWFRALDVAPTCTRRVRAWDFAATPEDASGKGDWTVGALLGQSGGTWGVLDIVRRRVAGGQVANLVKSVAAQDGTGVRVVIEQEPGASGVVASSYIVRELAGFNVGRSRPSADKLTRAMPLLAQAEAGNVWLAPGAWRDALLDELVAFPGGEHDDQVDAISTAFNELTRPQSSIATSW